MTPEAWIFLAGLLVALCLLVIVVLAYDDLARELRRADLLAIKQARRVNDYRQRNERLWASLRWVRIERNDALARVAELESRELPHLSEWGAR